MSKLLKDRLITVVYLIIFAVVILAACALSGCNEWMVQPNGAGAPVQLIQPTLVDALIDTVTALTVANTASTPVNPYATPINIGLAGIVAMLEALRRKEKAARKFAETNNHVQDKTGKGRTDAV